MLLVVKVYGRGTWRRTAVLFGRTRSRKSRYVGACYSDGLMSANTAAPLQTWEKPRALKTPAELEMEATPFKEYESGGRKYWVDSRDDSTTWDMPAAVKGALSLRQRNVAELISSRARRDCRQACVSAQRAVA